MNGNWQQLAKRAALNPNWRRLRAHAIRADGTHEQLNCDAVYIELDEERGLLVSLNERCANEGVAILSLPEGTVDPASFKPREDGMLISAPTRSSSLVMRGGGGNLLYVSPEAHTSSVIRPPNNTPEPIVAKRAKGSA